MQHMIIEQDKQSNRMARGRMCYLTNAAVDQTHRIHEIHQHKEITEIEFVYEGHGRHQIGNAEYFSEPGDILLYNFNQLHQDQPASDNETLQFYVFGMEDLNLTQLSNGNILANNAHCLLKSNQYEDLIYSMAQALESSLLEENPNAAGLAHGIYQILLTVIQTLLSAETEDAAGNDTKRSALAYDLQEYLNRHFAENFNLSDLAEQFHVNRYHVVHLFSREFGCSPMQYRTKRRIGEAQVLLIQSNRSITEIAGMVGYDDPNWFTQAFSKMIGMSPSQFRRLSVFHQET